MSGQKWMSGLRRGALNLTLGVNGLTIRHQTALSKAETARITDIEDLQSSKKGKRAAEPCLLCVPLDMPSLERYPCMYPRKVEKKKSRDEDIAVCVLEWVANEDPSQARILLVKRPKTGKPLMAVLTRLRLKRMSIGLLAGLDEFPSVVMPEDSSSAPGRLASSVDLLNELLEMPNDFHIKAVKDFTAVSVTRTTDLGSIKHIYSHINATFHCRHVVLTSGGMDESKPPQIRKENRERCKWISREDVDSANISTGAVKIWKLVTDGAVPAKATKPGKVKADLIKKGKKEESGQMKLSFTKKPVATVEEAIVNLSDLDPKSGDSVKDSHLSPRKKRRIDISSDEED